MSEEITLVDSQYAVSLDLDATVEAWVNKTSTSNLSRTKDTKNDKSRSILDFFDFAGKPPERILPHFRQDRFRISRVCC